VYYAPEIGLLTLTPEACAVTGFGAGFTFGSVVEFKLFGAATLPPVSKVSTCGGSLPMNCRSIQFLPWWKFSAWHVAKPETPCYADTYSSMEFLTIDSALFDFFP
jgi:hypothetical protein